MEWWKRQVLENTTDLDFHFFRIHRRFGVVLRPSSPVEIDCPSSGQLQPRSRVQGVTMVDGSFRLREILGIGWQTPSVYHAKWLLLLLHIAADRLKEKL